MPDFNMPGDTLGDTVHWFEAAVPSPSPKNMQTQLGVHFEEVAEMLDTLSAHDPQTLKLLYEAYEVMKKLGDHLKASDPNSTHLFVLNRTDLLDSLCDQVVTATGVGHMLDFEMVPAMREVNSSNYSKFVDGKPVFDANQKVRKGPNYFKASLEKYANRGGETALSESVELVSRV